jgi:hypothetical protein
MVLVSAVGRPLSTEPFQFDDSALGKRHGIDGLGRQGTGP